MREVANIEKGDRSSHKKIRGGSNLEKGDSVAPPSGLEESQNRNTARESYAIGKRISNNKGTQEQYVKDKRRPHIKDLTRGMRLMSDVRTTRRGGTTLYLRSDPWRLRNYPS